MKNKEMKHIVKNKSSANRSFNIEWGSQPKQDYKKYSNKHIVIPNRFDFGDAKQVCLRPYKQKQDEKWIFYFKNIIKE